jgi:hypothetical protein
MGVSSGNWAIFPHFLCVGGVLWYAALIVLLVLSLSRFFLSHCMDWLLLLSHPRFPLCNTHPEHFQTSGLILTTPFRESIMLHDTFMDYPLAGPLRPLCYLSLYCTNALSIVTLQ